jgi:hypothetical protein
MTSKEILSIALALVLFGACMRLFPHMPNMTPLTAIAIVGARYLRTRYAIMLPVVALALSDFVIGGYELPIMLATYGSFLAIGMLAYLMRAHGPALAATVLTAPSLFFIITNAAVWAWSPWYEKSAAGLLYAYELGLPFFKLMLMGDIAYTMLLVGVFEVVRRMLHAARTTTPIPYPSLLLRVLYKG